MDGWISWTRLCKAKLTLNRTNTGKKNYFCTEPVHTSAENLGQLFTSSSQIDPLARPDVADASLVHMTGNNFKEWKRPPRKHPSTLGATTSGFCHHCHFSRVLTLRTFKSSIWKQPFQLSYRSFLSSTVSLCNISFSHTKKRHLKKKKKWRQASQAERPGSRCKNCKGHFAAM